MRKLIFFLIAFVLFLPGLVWADASLTEDSRKFVSGYHLREIKYLVVCAADGSFVPADATTEDINGFVVTVTIAHTYATDPDGAYDFKALDGEGVDILANQGVGLNGADTDPSVFQPMIGGTPMKYPVVGDLTFSVANQGTADAGFYVTIKYWSVEP